MLNLFERITAHPDSNDMGVLAELVALSLPPKPEHSAEATSRLRMLIQRLKGNPLHAAALRRYLLHALSQCRHITLYTDTGILPRDGFFSELFRRLSFRVLLPPSIACS